MSATVTGNLKTLGTAVPGGNPTVRFWLYNTGGNIPRVIGTGVIVPNYVDFTADASGAISGSIYKNSEIDVGGATNTYYHVEFINLTGVVPSANYSITTATFDITSAAPITSTPTITPPTGDNTYLRLDGGNIGSGFGASLPPSSNNSFDLGSSGSRWRDGWFARNVTLGSIDNSFIYIDGTTYSTLQQAHDALPSGGGMILVPSGTFNFSATQAFTKPVIIQGAGKDATIIQLTTTGSNLHAVTSTKSLTVRDLTIKVQTPPSSNLTMKAIDVDTPVLGGSGITLIVDCVKITGFNIGIFADGRGAGLTNFDLDRVVIRNSDVTLSGAASTVAESVDVHGASQALIENNTLDNNSLGDHVVYAIRNNNLIVRGNRLKNTAGNSACGIKAITANVFSAFSFTNWVFQDNEITNTVLPCYVAPTDNATLDNVKILGNTITTATSTNSAEAAVLISPQNTSVIKNVELIGNKIDSVQVQGVLFDAAAGATISNALIVGGFIRDFSKVSGGTYNAVSTGSVGTLSQLSTWNLRVDGNTTGRAAFPSKANNRFTRVQLGDVVETATTTTSLSTYTFTQANQVSHLRSAGTNTTPDLIGDGTNDLVIGGKSDGSGGVSFGATTAVKVPSTFQVGGDSAMSANPRGIYTGFIPTTNATGTWAQIAFDKAITLTRVQIIPGTQGAGQTTAAIVRVGDNGSNNIDTTIANGTAAFDSGTITTNIAAATNVIIRVNTASSGGTPPANLNVVVQYRMQ